MGFSFLTPLFLAGLAALAVPIIVHLTHSARRDVVPFPSLMFVRQIPFRSMRRQRIRHWLLFALRCAAILLLVAAFARPLLDRSADAAMALSRARELVILLDRSYSMGHADRWERARDAASRAIAGLAQDDRATLITFAERVESMSRRTADAAVLRASLDAAELGYAGTRYAPVLQAAGEIVQRTDRPRSEVILISDFQRVGWEAAEVSRLPAGTAFKVVDVSDPGAANAAVAGVMLERDRRPGGERVAVSARIVNFGADALEDQEVRLELDGVGTRVRQLDIGSGETITVQFEPLSLPQRLTRGTVGLAGDRLTADDNFHFVVRPDPPVRVLLAGPDAASLLYVRRVLEIGEDPAFDVTVSRSSRLNAGHFQGQDVAILHDMPAPRGAARDALSEFVRDGGGLLLVLGRRTLPSAWEPLEPLLPGSFGAPVDRSADGGSTLSSLNRKHPVFEVFRAPHSGDFTAARFFRYRGVEPETGAAVLARFNDGTAALTERGVGKGRVLVWASDLENFWNDLVVQPVFLPFLHRMTAYLAEYRSPRLWLSAGEVLDLSDRSDGDLAAAMEGELILEEPGGGRAVLRADEGESTLLELSRPGFYQIRRASGGAGSQPVYTVAVNLDVSESDLATVDPTEVAGAVVSEAETGRPVGADVAELLTPTERERRQGLWWYLLAAALLLLLIESVLSNMRGRAVVSRVGSRAG